MRIALLTAALFLVAACETTPTQTSPAPAPAAPQITEQVLRDRAQSQLAQGVKQYEAGEYEAAVKSLSGALDHGLLSKADQSRARKYIAFSHCVSGREAQCRAEFRKAFEINPEFALTPAEDGHPIWGPVYRGVRTQLISEREASSGKPLITFSKSEELLQDGLTKYDAGDYPAAQKALEAAMKEGLRDKADQVKALKHIAFCQCLVEKWRDCRATFVRIYDVDPNFDLTPAEAGHPSWTRTFAGAKAQAKRALQEKAAREAKEKLPTAPAAVPKKK